MDGAITALGFGDSDQYLANGDQVVLAVPPGQLRRFFPDLPLPADNSAPWMSPRWQEAQR